MDDVFAGHKMRLRPARDWILRARDSAILTIAPLFLFLALSVVVTVLMWFVLRDYLPPLRDYGTWIAIIPVYLLALVYCNSRVAERIMLRWRFGRRARLLTLMEWAAADRDSFASTLMQGHPVSGRLKVVASSIFRLFLFRDLFPRLRNLELHAAQEVHNKTLKEIRDKWRAGSYPDPETLRRIVKNLLDLATLVEPDRLLGQAVAANITYLLGDLEAGRRIADQTMRESEQYDEGRLPVFQWFASYAYANSRLFLGQFEVAATLLGTMWQSMYMSLPPEQQEQLKKLLAGRSTLNPLAAVPRHIILASAFANRALRRYETQPDPNQDITDDWKWVKRWYKLGLRHSNKGEPDEKRNNISLHFTRGYMALYCLGLGSGQQVDGIALAEKLLRKIPDDAPAVARHVKHTVNGLRLLFENNKDSDALALTEFAEADCTARGNQFLDGILHPARAIAGARGEKKSNTAKDALKKGRRYAKRAQSAFYDSLLDAAAAVVAQVDGQGLRASYLLDRARRNPGALTGLFEPIL